MHSYFILSTLLTELEDIKVGWGASLVISLGASLLTSLATYLTIFDEFWVILSPVYSKISEK